MTSKKHEWQIGEILHNFEKTIGQLVLYCITELPFPMGVKKTIDILKGNKSSFVINHGLNKLETFSVLPGYTRDQLSDIIDIMIFNELIAVDYIRAEGEKMPVLAITEKGKEFLHRGLPAEFVLLDVLMDKDVPDITEEDQDLFYKLKLARRQLAEEFDFPAFMICKDSVLRAMCIKKPVEQDDLLKIKGVGKKFMENYSKQFLYVIRQYVTREKSS
jgi:ATP-dependent DNA helicase RecQ